MTEKMYIIFVLEIFCIVHILYCIWAVVYRWCMNGFFSLLGHETQIWCVFCLYTLTRAIKMPQCTDNVYSHYKTYMFCQEYTKVWLNDRSPVDVAVYLTQNTFPPTCLCCFICRLVCKQGELFLLQKLLNVENGMLQEQ